MRHAKRLICSAFLVATVIALTAGRPCAEETKEDAWDHAFKGHEMWVTSLDSGLATSLKQNKPLLIDFYSRH